MPEMEIAGLKVIYRTVSDLHAKLVGLLESVHQKRLAASQAHEALRKQEESIRRVLGGCSGSENGGAMSGKTTHER